MVCKSAAGLSFHKSNIVHQAKNKYMKKGMIHGIHFRSHLPEVVNLMI